MESHRMKLDHFKSDKCKTKEEVSQEKTENDVRNNWQTFNREFFKQYETFLFASAKQKTGNKYDMFRLNEALLLSEMLVMHYKVPRAHHHPFHK